MIKTFYFINRTQKLQLRYDLLIISVFVMFIESVLNVTFENYKGIKSKYDHINVNL